MKKINPRCDVHMYPKIPNARFLFLWLQFLGDVVCFHPTIYDVQPDIFGDISMQQSPFGSIVFYLWYLEVAWSWRKIFVLMASGRLNIAHPILRSKKPRFKCKANIKYVNGILVPCYSRFWVQLHSGSLEHHMH